MSVVAPISSAAAIVPVTASVAAGERPATAVALGMGLALVGAALACAERGDGDARRAGRLVPGAALALVSALCFGAFFVAMDAATDEAGPAWAVALNRSTSVAVLLVAVAVVRPRLSFARGGPGRRRRPSACSTAPPTRCSPSPSRRASRARSPSSARCTR